MNDYKKRYYKIVNLVVKKSFPELKDKSIKILEMPTVSRYTQSFSMKGINSYYIFMFSNCRNRNSLALKGQLAHELCHLVLDYYDRNVFSSVWHLFIKIISTGFNTKFNRIIETKIDKETIKRGYRKERLALAKDWEKNYSKKELEKVLYSRGYLRPMEIEG